MTNITRRATLFGLAIAAAVPAPALAMRVPRVLFICRYATVKSATARELLRKRAREWGWGLRCGHAGSRRSIICPRRSVSV